MTSATRSRHRRRPLDLLTESLPRESRQGSELWEILQRVLPSEREQRLAYLLYHCNLKPREIVRFCPQEWTDVQEIYRLRRTILERLLRQADQLALAVQSARAGVKEKSHAAFADRD